ncbi:MAG: hypothetical protein ACI3V3_04295 [Faecousia sp.]
MAVNRTVQAIFDKAMYLMDAQNESTGNTDNSDTREYKVRTIGILNNLLDLVYPASDTFAIGEDGKRPALDDITGFEDELDLDPRILRDVLPNGLAAKLLSEENPALADYFQQCFEQSLAEARNRIPASFESIDDCLPYGGLEYGEFGRW